MDFKLNQEYSRRRDIHDRYQGQQMGGICTPRGVKAIFLFTGESGEQFGYVDQWSQDGSYYSFAGAGQKGDMAMTGVNAAVLNHEADGKELHLFTALGKGKPIRYEGQFRFWRHRIERGVDASQQPRNIIVFDLVPLFELAPTEDQAVAAALRRRLTHKVWSVPPAAVLRPERSTSQSVQGAFKRSIAVVDYVLKEAKSHCELCGGLGPFLDGAGKPYLEVHHVIPLAEKGADAHWNAVALCPNCHRRLHLGQDAKQARELLYQKVTRLLKTPPVS